MSTAAIIALIQALSVVTPTLISQLFSIGKSEDAPTLEELTALSVMVKRSESYFEK
jgi:hypothetical protein